MIYGAFIYLYLPYIHEFVNQKTFVLSMTTGTHQGFIYSSIILFPAIYKHLLSDKKFGLTVNLLACKVMPTLIPHTVAPGLNMDQVSSNIE